MTSDQQRRRRTSGRPRHADAAAESVMTPGAFEEAQARLDEIIATLEEGHVPLAEALELHAEGGRLYALLVRMLDEAELRVQRLHATLPDGGADDETVGADGAHAEGSVSFFLETLELEDGE